LASSLRERVQGEVRPVEALDMGGKRVEAWVLNALERRARVRAALREARNGQ
jgi:hypothetical protein